MSILTHEHERLFLLIKMNLAHTTQPTHFTIENSQLCWCNAIISENGLVWGDFVDITHCDTKLGHGKIWTVKLIWSEFSIQFGDIENVRLSFEFVYTGLSLDNTSPNWSTVSKHFFLAEFRVEANIISRNGKQVLIAVILIIWTKRNVDQSNNAAWERVCHYELVWLMCSNYRIILHHQEA